MQRLEIPLPHLLNAGLTTTMPSFRLYFRYSRETLVEMARLLSQSWRAPYLPYPRCWHNSDDLDRRSEEEEVRRFLIGARIYHMDSSKSYSDCHNTGSQI